MSETAWDRAALALRLLALDPRRLGGAVIRMRACPQRDAVTDALGPLRKIPLSITDAQLFGGIDVSATLRLGRKVMTRGMLHSQQPMTLPMSERCTSELGARLAQALDTGQIAGLICLDEGIGADETTPEALADRLAFHIAPEGRLPDGWESPTPGKVAPSARIAPTQIEALVTLSHHFGIASARAALMAIAAAEAHARLMGRDLVLEDDIATAAALVYPHRATRVPEDADDTAPPPPPDAHPEEGDASGSATDLPSELLVETVAALLPDDLLQRIAARAARAKGQGAGDTRKSNRRGRPLPARPGRLDGSRIDLVATLRAAAPWQTIRRAEALANHTHRDAKVLLRGQDIRVKRYQQRSDRVLIFAVDASGSAALARLGEAKGAVELLLADAYAQRDHVALIAFRGSGADVLLPPTRSLVQTKRRLAALPGGGGTPLAAGLQEANAQARLARLRGLAPTLVLLTDGRANIALDGASNRAAAQSDAEGQARVLRRDGTQGLVIDTGIRPSPALENLSQTLDSPYIPMPRADARRLQKAIQGALTH